MFQMMERKELRAKPKKRPERRRAVSAYGKYRNDAGRVEPQKRLASLDAFRGLTILGMLLVNNVALDTATPKYLTHAGWNQGINFADLVFPWFLLIVGVAIPFAVASNKKKGLTTWGYIVKAFSRAVILVLLGCLIDSSLARQPVFDLGVLQIIGLAYLVGALVYELPLAGRLVLAIILLTAHWAAIRFVPVPGLGTGVLDDGHNFVDHLNQVYLQPLHLSGLVSVVPTSALVMLGTIIGDLLRRDDWTYLRKSVFIIAGSLALLGAGWVWSLDLPFNKAMWTASYILFTAGLGAALLGLFYLLIDVRGWKSPAFPLVVLGSNAIFAYVAPILLKLYILQVWTWPDGSELSIQQAFLNFGIAHAGRIAGGWLYTFSFIVFWWLVLFQLYRKKIFMRV